MIKKLPLKYSRMVFRDLAGQAHLEPEGPASYRAVLHVGTTQKAIGHVTITPNGRHVDSRGLCGAVGWDSIHCAVNGLVYADFMDHNGRFINKRFTPPLAGEPHGANLNNGMRETE